MQGLIQLTFFVSLLGCAEYFKLLPSIIMLGFVTRAVEILLTSTYVLKYYFMYPLVVTAYAT
jgi:hypothetical protein